jgi:hypothetical protein
MDLSYTHIQIYISIYVYVSIYYWELNSSGLVPAVQINWKILHTLLRLCYSVYVSFSASSFWLLVMCFLCCRRTNKLSNLFKKKHLGMLKLYFIHFKIDFETNIMYDLSKNSLCAFTYPCRYTVGKSKERLISEINKIYLLKSKTFMG